MHRAQILLEDWQYDTLRQEAERQGKSISELVRNLLSERYSNRMAKPGLGKITGIVSDPQSSGKDHDVYLYDAKKR